MVGSLRQLGAGLYGLEDEILMGALRAMKVSPKGGLEAVLGHAKAPDPDAHQLYLEARYYWNVRTHEALEQAIELYRKALAIDPGYARAEAGIAQCYGVMAANGLAGREAAVEGKRAAEKAIAMDPTESDAYAALGLIRSVGDWDFRGAEASFRQAIALNPSDASAWQWRAHNLLWQGRFDEAREAIQKANDLDSLSLVILSNQAEFAYYMRNFDEALRLYDRVLAVDPGFISANIERGMTLEHLRKYQESLASYQKALNPTKEEASPLVGMAQTYAHMGRAAEARRILSDFETGNSPLHVNLFQLAAIHAALGETSRAMDLLEEAYARRESFLIQIKVHPDVDPLRKDPRFAELQKKVGL